MGQRLRLLSLDLTNSVLNLTQRRTDGSIGINAAGLGTGHKRLYLLPHLLSRDGLVGELHGDPMSPSPRDHLLGTRQGAHGLGDAVQRRYAALLLTFASLPAATHVLWHLPTGKDVGVSANQFVGNSSGHVVEGEAPLVLGYLGVEVDLEQQVTELLQQICICSGLDGVDHLAGLLN